MQKNSLTGLMSVVKSVKQMVSTQPEAGSTAPDDSSGTFNKIWQVGSGFMTSGSNVTKIGPAKVTPVETIQPKETPVIEPPKAKTEQEKLAACRICIKSIKPEDFSRTCSECQRTICEDCASYSTQKDTDDPTTWRCSVCRRKLAPRGEPAFGNETTNGSLEVPMEGLARRHSDVRLNSQGTGATVGTLGAGLVPPRSPDLRRHSDVSPASLKDLEKFRKFAGEQQRRGSNVSTAGDDWDGKQRSKSRGDSPDRQHDRGPIDRGRGSSPQRSRRPSAVPDQDSGDIDEEEDRRHREMRAAQMGGGGSVRRHSRVTRQHSYDDEIKTATVASSSGAHGAHPATEVAALGLPVRLARRKSDIAIYSTGGGPPGLAAIVPPQHRASISTQGTREPDVPPVSTSRRPSMRVSSKPLLADEATAPDQIIPSEELMMKRRGSILPKIPTSARPSVVPGPIPRVPVDDRELARQGSVADGEAIKIVIHDVDSDMLPRTKRKVILRKDVVVEKGHRTRSFGMRVVGGKAGGDHRLYAVVVWTVTGGPAEKAGLQKGDKVLEWGGVSLIDRTFEEVAHIIDRSGDVAELVVEHANDMSGDSMDEPVGMAPTEREKTPSNLGLGQLESESNKAPSSPTRRKLPKTPV